MTSTEFSQEVHEGWLYNRAIADLYEELGKIHPVALMEAVRRDDWGTVRDMEFTGVDLEDVTPRGATIGLLAVAHNKYRIVRFLFKLGVNMTIRSDRLGTIENVVLGFVPGIACSPKMKTYVIAKAYCFHARCGTGTGKYKCQACYNARYCSTACQHADWPRHKAACKLFKAARLNQAAQEEQINDVQNGREETGQTRRVGQQQRSLSEISVQFAHRDHRDPAIGGYAVWSFSL
jgi:hypothetical protein